MTVPSGYQPSPRPSFASAAVIARAAAARHVWGDAESGEVLDRIYVSNDRIHQLLFEISPGGQFTHSASFRTVFGADEVLYAVDGDLVVANPETGQLVRVCAGEAVFFGPDTWHHAFNWGTGTARVLEYFAPPPATGTSGAYAQQRPLLESSSYAGDAALGQDTARPGRLTVVRVQDYIWRLDGDRAPVLTGIIASTPRLTVVRCEVRGTGWSGWLSHVGDTGGYVLAGTLLLQLGNRAWHELGPGDGFYLPGGERYQVRNAAAGITSYLAGSAPTSSQQPGSGSPASEAVAGAAAGDVAAAGGTKTALGLIDAASLTLLATDVIPTGPERGGEAVLRDVSARAAALAEAATQLGRHTVGLGVAVPEIVDLAGQITSNAVIPRWNELPVAAVLGAIAPTAVEADVRAAAFAEASLGAGQDYGYHLFLTVGTGISYCAVGAGRPFAGAHGGALNIGTSVLTLPVADGGPLDSEAFVDGWPSADGRPGAHEIVLERVASGSALVQRYTARGGRAQRAEDVLAAARDGDAAASEVVDTGAKALGIGIALLVNLLDPEAVITGGGLGSADTEYWAAAQHWARHYAHSHAADTVLTRSRLGPDAGVIGAGLVGLLAQHRLRHTAANRDSTGHGSTRRGNADRVIPGRGATNRGIPNSSSDKRK